MYSEHNYQVQSIAAVVQILYYITLQSLTQPGRPSHNSCVTLISVS